MQSVGNNHPIEQNPNRQSQPKDQILEIWRESYGWWNDEPYREIKKIITPQGKVITCENETQPLGQIRKSDQKGFQENHHEEVELLIRKVRDEKAAAALGNLNHSHYNRRIEERHEIQNPTPKQYPSSLNFSKGIAHLHVLSGYSFGQSILLPEEIAFLSARMGCHSVAICDHFSLAGAVELDRACRKVGIKPIIGAGIELEDFPGDLILIAQNQIGYRNLSRLISDSHLNQPRNFPLATWDMIAQNNEGLICLTGGDFGPLDRLLVSNQKSKSELLIRQLQTHFPKRLYLEIEHAFLPWSKKIEKELIECSAYFHIPIVAAGAITHHQRENFPAQDIVACSHFLATLDDPIGRKPFRDPTQNQCQPFPRRSLNAERTLKSESNIKKLYEDHPDWLNLASEIAHSCENSVLPQRPSLPKIYDNDAQTLRDMVEAGAYLVYPQITAKHRQRLKTELDRIIKLGFANHFLIAAEMCRWAKEQNIHFSGRGSVVDSAVAHVLGFSRIDAIQHKLHFDRFLPADGSKRPDIDIDFEAHRRDDVRGYLIHKFGVERTACVSAFGSYRVRGIVREIGKAMELPQHLISDLAKRLHGGVSPDQLESALDKRPELRDNPINKAKFRWIFKLARDLTDVPFGIGCHSSGLVICADPIRDFVPVQPSGSSSSITSQSTEPYLRIMQWDKRSAKHYFDKFDILCLRGQDVLSGTEEKIRIHNPDFKSTQVPSQDPEVFRAMRSGELIGIPQSASPAMRQAHIRLRTDNLDDASLVQAGIRPGVGGAVKINELIARRRGKPFTYEHPEFEKILGNTYGIIVFQEQVDQLLQCFCGCSSGEAEDIRDAIHKRRREDYGNAIREQLIEKCLKNGYSFNVAEKICELVAGFKGYGFAQGHALAFAEISLRCVWLMQNEPASYFASLLSAQPAGYYGPCTIANEARCRGIQILAPSVIKSDIPFTIENAYDLMTNLQIPGAAIRTGLMQIAELSDSCRKRIIDWNQITRNSQINAFANQTQQVHNPSQFSGTKNIAIAQENPQAPTSTLLPFRSFFDFVKKIQPQKTDLEALIMCGALDYFCANRRAMLWAIPVAQKFASYANEKPLQSSLPMTIPEPELDLSVIDFDIQERAVLERSFLGMDIDQHLMAFERQRIRSKSVTSIEVKNYQPGTQLAVVGNPIRLRFPPTSSGKRVVFFDLEDEFGLLNVTAFDDVYEKYGRAMITCPYVTVVGQVQNRDGHIAFLAERVYEYKPILLKSRQKQIPISGSDFLMK